MVEKIEKAMKNVKGKTITIFGLAFKPETMILERLPQWLLLKNYIKEVQK
ncbi:hypothetical protein ES705_23141 [subsurface metagenome]